VANSTKVEEFPDCEICYCSPAEVAGPCGHRACLECWQGNCAGGNNRCFHGAAECPIYLSKGFIDRLGKPNISGVVARRETNGYIQAHSKQLKYCPESRCSVLLFSPWIREAKIRNGEWDNVIECPTCESSFCLLCADLPGQKQKAPEGHIPTVLCTHMSDWNAVIKNMDDSITKEDRFEMFRLKNCPKCDTVTVKCGCNPLLSQCGDSDFCPNQACNHMHCGSCNHDYCWVCLGDWYPQHGSSWYQCNQKTKSSGLMNPRFKFCFLQYNNHANGLESFRQFYKDWIKVASEVGLPSPAEHWVPQMIRKVIEMERVLKYSYVALFYLTRTGFRAWRAAQKPCEALVEVMKTTLEKDLDFREEAQAGERVTEKAQELIDVQGQIAEKLDHMGTWFWKYGELLEKAEDAMEHNEVINFIKEIAREDEPPIQLRSGGTSKDLSRKQDLDEYRRLKGM